MRYLWIFAVILQSFGADPIPNSRRVPWVPGQTVGVIGGLRRKTNLIDVTQAPYFVDKTGVTNAGTGITTAIAAATAGQVIYTPAGKYLFTTPVTCNKSDIGFLGDGPGTGAAFTGTNTVWMSTVPASAVLTLGHGEPAGNSTRQYTVASGATFGSTNISLTTGTNTRPTPEPLLAGTIMRLSTSTRNIGTPTYPVISVANFDYLIKQTVRVVSRAGTNIVVWPPLCWNFTNSAIMQEIAWPGGAGPLPASTNLTVEGIQFTGTNYGNGTTTGSAFMVNYSLCTDSMITNCAFYYGFSYNMFGAVSINMEIRHCDFQFAQSAGTSHAGYLVNEHSGLLFEDNILCSGLGPGMEYNQGMFGNAIAYNYFTGNIQDIDCHQAHSAFNLLEGNVGSYYRADGYFGSESDETLFRNRLAGTVQFKRWVSHMNATGNILGTNIFDLVYETDTNNYPNYPIFELGFPNINNPFFDATTDTVAWNWPGSHVNYTGHDLTNGVNVLVSEGPTNTLSGGSFTNIPISQVPNTPMVVQSGANTNYYYTWTNNTALYSFLAGTPTNLLLWNGTTTNVLITVTNGDTLFMAGQSAYQWLQKQLKPTHILTMNGVYTNFQYALVNDPLIADTNIPSSYLYASKPAWMGTNAFPAVGPDLVGLFSPIPAQDRFNGTFPAVLGPAMIQGNARISGTIIIR